jgi:hypothetical protein
LTILALWRIWLAMRLRIELRAARLSWPVSLRFGAIVGATGSLALWPIVWGLARRVYDGRFPHTPILWRSSPPGVDLLSVLSPNPNHPWFGAASRLWIEQSRPDAYPELVGAVSLVAIGLIALAAWRDRGAGARFWMAFTAFFALIALGPFVQIAHTNTYVPTPWALLRYVPGLDLARAPSRFAIPATLGLSICLGFAIARLRTWPRHAMAITYGGLALLTIELLPAPRPLYDAAVPSVYSVIRADTDESQRVLDLPTGIRDGTSSLGDFNASSQYFQTVHRKRLIGGYQSRVTQRRKEANLREPAMAALLTLSEGRVISDDVSRAAFDTRDRFVDEACIGYVVIDRRRASTDLRRFAVKLFDLERVAEDRDKELFRPHRRSRRPGCAAATGQ